jgi:hypothetical protein
MSQPRQGRKKHRLFRPSGAVPSSPADTHSSRCGLLSDAPAGACYCKGISIDPYFPLRTSCTMTRTLVVSGAAGHSFPAEDAGGLCSGVLKAPVGAIEISPMARAVGVRMRYEIAPPGAEETPPLPPLRGCSIVCPAFPWLAPWATFWRPYGANSPASQSSRTSRYARRVR